LDNHKDFAWQNVEMIDNLREGEDFFLVTSDVLNYASKIYGITGRPVVRYGIEQQDGETVIELYLKKLQVFPVPAKPFSVNIPKWVIVSRAAKIEELKAKIIRVLNGTAFAAGNK